MERITRTWRGAVGAFAALAFGAACALLTMPEDIAKDRYTREVRHFGLDVANPLRTVTRLRRAVASEFDRANLFDPTGGKEPATTFLHLSDAQIRDEKLHATWGRGIEIRGADLFISSSVRPPLVDKFDALALGAFLVAQEGRINEEGVPSWRSRQFVVHTGDLLDISAVTEVIAGLRVFRELQPPEASADAAVEQSEIPRDRRLKLSCVAREDAPAPGAVPADRKLRLSCVPQEPAPEPSDAPPDPETLKFYSVAGNHDGLRFGTVHDRYTGEDHGISLNRTEFVLAHLMLDRRLEDDLGLGFGFGRNEVIRAFATKPTSVIEAMEQLPPMRREALERQGDAVRRVLPRRAPPRREPNQPREDSEREEKEQDENEHEENELIIPIGLRRKIKIQWAYDVEAEQLGYYEFLSSEWMQDRPPDVPVVRHLVLDTRASDSHQGHVGWVQLGWLYNQLVDALERQEIVVILAHHGPAAFRRCGFFSSTCPETRVLERMLDAFPHLVGYFHGHLHRNEEGFWRDDRTRFPLIQTGSIADFPQVGRLVWIETDAADDGSGEARIRWDFVRPRGKSQPEGRVLDALLEARCEEALEDLGSRGARKHSIRTCGPLQKDLQDEREKLPGAFPNVRYGFEVEPEKISPDAIFGSHLEEVDLQRSALRLERVKHPQDGDRRVVGLRESEPTRR